MKERNYLKGLGVGGGGKMMIGLEEVGWYGVKCNDLPQGGNK